MRVQTFEELLFAYNKTMSGIDRADIINRNEMLTRYKYSVIVEGEWSEFENLEKWIKINFDIDSFEQIWYGKTGYDYGFVEYFVNNERGSSDLQLAIPNIFTVYPNSYPPGQILKSDGYGKDIIYDSSNKEAIIFK